MIELRDITKIFPSGSDTAEVRALDHVSLSIADGDIYGVIGMSGAGKSTLVRCINYLEKPSSGQIVIDGRDLSTLSDKEIRALRRSISMIFQNFNLLMQRNCLANVTFPMEIAGVPKKQAEQRAYELLDIVGLREKAKAYPAQLSGGQKQRIAIARALASDPKVLLCDEATSALDPKTTRSILELIRKINEQMGITVIFITHQMSVVEEVCRHVAILDDGKVAEEGEVAAVFSSPKSDAARKLVFPDQSGDVISGKIDGQKIRVVFNGSASVSAPLITQMAIDEGIAANILYASTRSIGDRVFGSMLLGIPRGTLERVKNYFERNENISVEEVSEGA